MNRLNENDQVPESPAIRVWLFERFQKVARKVNGLASGRFADLDGIGTAAPTTGTYALGDTIRNSNPSEAGGAGNKYVIIGWICTTAGTPGTWKEMRTLTGN
jgi:hypothetical protein